MADMTEDPFADTSYGKAALDKIKPTDPNFRLYYAGFMEDGPPITYSTMMVKGAVFREAKSGPNKGQLSIMVPGTIKVVYLTKQEMEKFK